MSKRAITATTTSNGGLVPKDAGNGSARPSTPYDKQKILLSSDTGHFSLMRALHLADFITELNGACGVLSVLSSMRFCLDGDPKNLWFALAFLPFGLFFDFLDGKVARWRGKSSMMGQELDSLADLISFGVAPAAVAFALGLRTAADHVILTFFVLCGLTRLARFNVTASAIPKDASGKAAYFEGTPIPTTLFLDAAMAVCLWQGWWVGGQGVSAAGVELVPGGLWFRGSWLEMHPAALVFAVHGCLMTSKTIRIPKP